MNTTDKKNSTFGGNQGMQDRNKVMNEELYELNDMKKTDNDNQEIADRGYTVRNGHNPNKPNPDEGVIGYEDDLDDLNDDFHNENDLDDDNDNNYEIELEDEEEYVEEDLEENDEFNNPEDTFENDFTETEDALDDIDDEDEDDENSEYIEDDVQEEDSEDDYSEEDPRKF